MKCCNCNNLATKQYKRHKKRVYLCSDCYDKYSIQDIYESNLLRISQLARNKEYDKAYSLLDEIKELTRDRDHDGWLNYCINEDKGMLLQEQGKILDALEIYRHSCPVDTYSYLNNQTLIAKILITLNYNVDAMSELAKGIVKAREPEYFAAFDALNYYAIEACKASLDTPFNIYEKYVVISQYYGLLCDTSNYIAKDACKEIKNKYIMYLDLQRRLNDLRAEIKGNIESSIEIKIRMINEYIKNERNAYCKIKAKQLLEDLIDNQ